MVKKYSALPVKEINRKYFDICLRPIDIAFKLIYFVGFVKCIFFIFLLFVDAHQNPVI